MKVLIVNTSDILGGAARAAYRLHRSLLVSGVNSHMLVQDKSSDDYSVIGPDSFRQKLSSKIRPVIDRFPIYRYKNRNQTLFSPSWPPFSEIVDKINQFNPDIVHLHWIAGGMLRIEDIAKIKAPIVWSLHDNWAFTGGCHIMWDCQKYKTTCGCCPVLGSLKERDLSYSIFFRKKKVFDKKKGMVIVGVSEWIANCAKESSLFKHHKVVCLPNPINTNTYSPFDKLNSRELFNLPIDKKLIAFGAMDATSDLNKGFKELSKALSYLDKENIELVVFGSSKPKESISFKHHVHYLGQLKDDVSLRVLYSAVDVMVVPSRQEAFGQTASEAMACGTPVVAFGITGLLDIIDHKKNGYLAEPCNVVDLFKGINWVLYSSEYEQLCNNARNKITENFDSKLIAEKYIQLYRKILCNSL